jgi:hypothetical protein
MVNPAIPLLRSLPHACTFQLRDMHVGTPIVPEQGLKTLFNSRHGLHYRLICALNILRDVPTNHAKVELLRLQGDSEVILRYDCRAHAPRIVYV